ncbi:hypothetical protein LIER_40168 [Lithospermum erythrorhizon]|uniref:Uncharacterized protein n=1 Tax=Lithospermum erythrorhizon TaxID=34254 RepID=A0AAV3QSV5_LITER
MAHSASSDEATEATQKTGKQSAVNKTCSSASHLANLLPTGTLLSFQLLSPIFSNLGECDAMSRGLTGTLVSICALSCFLASFTDSLKDETGKVSYGFATLNGLWIIDGSPTTLPPAMATKYKLKFVDFVHAFMSLLIFLALSLFDKNVINCFFSDIPQIILNINSVLPVGIGLISCYIFVNFPTTRRGIGFSISLSS